MNKTVNINLGGMFFHIDEDAYQKMTRYFDAIKRSLSNSNGQDEIIKDIEMRIGELISEKHTSEKQVISLKELDEVIAIMGQPEDYRIDNDGEDPKTQDYINTGSISKKLYRDRETGIVGGVLSGLGHYFGIDKVWLRVILLCLVLFYGTGILAYIILWIVMPEAVTTTEKLEMKGEPITISNIEKKVREEYENVSERFKNVNYDKMGKQVKTGADKFATSIGDVFISIFKVFAKILGVLMILCSLPIIVMLLIGVFTLGTSAFTPFPWEQFIEAGNFSDYPVWSFGLLMFFAVGIPFFFLAILGFKLLISNMKSIGNIAKYTLLAIWLISVALLVTIGIRQMTEFAFDGKIVQKETINLSPTDTLQIKFRRNDDYSNDFHHHDFMIALDSTNTRVIYSNDVDFYIERTDEKVPYLQIDRQAKGASLSEAKKTAEKIKYGYKIQGNQLILDNYLLTDFKNKFRDQQIAITLYLPKGVKFQADESVRDYDNSEDGYFNLHYSSDRYTYEVGDSQVKCLDCPAEENEFDDVQQAQSKDSTTVTTVKVNGEIINIETSHKSGLTTDKDGVIIKNQ